MQNGGNMALISSKVSEKLIKKAVINCSVSHVAKITLYDRIWTLGEKLLNLNQQQTQENLARINPGDFRQNKNKLAGINAHNPDEIWWT